MKQFALILAALCLFASTANAQRRYIIPATACADGQCVPAKPAKKPATQPQTPTPKPQDPATTRHNPQPQTPSPQPQTPSPKPQTPSPKPQDPMLAETLLRGDCLVDTSADIHATPDMVFAAAASLPEDDREMFYCTIYHDDTDAESKALLEAWETSDVLRALADPLVPNSPSAKCKFLTVNINDVTQRPLIAHAAIQQTPCVIIQSAKIDTPEVPKNTQVARISGYSGDVAAYEKKILLAFQTGLERIASEQIAAYVPASPPTSGAAQTSRRRIVTPKIPPVTTLDRQEVEPVAGIDFHVNVPELPPEMVTPAVDLLNDTNDGFKQLKAVAIKAVWVLVIGVLVILSIPTLIVPALRLCFNATKKLAAWWWASARSAWQGGASQTSASEAPDANVASCVVPDVVDNVVSELVNIPRDIAIEPAEPEETLVAKVARLERQLAAQKGVNTKLKKQISEWD